MAEAESATPVSVGSALTYARVAGGWTHDDVCQHLKLPLATVVALERDNFSVVGAPIYVRGFVRSYARMVGLPETGFDEQLQAHFAALVEPDLKPSHGARRSFNWGERYSWAFSYLVGTVLVLTLIWTIIGFESDTQRLASELPVDSAPPKLVVTEPHVGDNDNMFATGLEEGSGPAGSNSEPPQPAPVMASMSPFSGTDPIQHAAVAGAFSLQLDAPSWVEITDANGRRVAFGTLSGGPHGFDGVAPFSVLIGNAQTASLRVGTQLLDFSTFMRANVARFRLENDGNGLAPVSVR